LHLGAKETQSQQLKVLSAKVLKESVIAANSAAASKKTDIDLTTSYFHIPLTADFVCQLTLLITGIQGFTALTS